MDFVARRAGVDLAGLRRGAALVGRGPRGLLGRDLGLLRRPRAHAVRARAERARCMPGARWFEGATLNYAEHMVGPDEDTGRVAIVARSQSRDPFELTFGELRDQVAPRAGRPRAPRRRPRRPRRRLPAEHPRDARRVPRDGEPRRGLGDVRARVRRRARDRPLRHRRAEGPARGRRLRLRRQARRPRAPRSPRSGPSSARSSTSSTSPTRAATDDAPARRDRLGRPAGRARRSCASTRCRSTTRCASCSRPARPGCRSRSSTATAGSSSRASRTSA